MTDSSNPTTCSALAWPSKPAACSPLCGTSTPAEACSKSAGEPTAAANPAVSSELRAFWDSLSLQQRGSIMRVGRKELFQRIRELYCSRCYGAFQIRYEELRSVPMECPLCRECYAGLVVLPDGSISLEQHILAGEPFTTLATAVLQRGKRDLAFAFACGKDLCGSGWQKKPGVHQCALHTHLVPPEACRDFWASLPPEHASELFCLPEEDFLAELDGHMKYQLKVCKDCRVNVVRSFKDLRSGKKTAATSSSSSSSGGSDAGGGSDAMGTSDTHNGCRSGRGSDAGSSSSSSKDAGVDASRRKVCDDKERVEPVDAAALETCKQGAKQGCSTSSSCKADPAVDPEPCKESAAGGSNQGANSSCGSGASAADAGPNSPPKSQGSGLEVAPGARLVVEDGWVKLELQEGDASSFFKKAEEVFPSLACAGVVRHAETPELAATVLAEAALLILHGQVEVAYREQLAAHNALLLLVVLVLQMMEGQLCNAHRDLQAKKAEEELLQMWDVQAAKPAKKSKKSKQAAKKARDKAKEARHAGQGSPEQQQQQQAASIKTEVSQESQQQQQQQRQPAETGATCGCPTGRGGAVLCGHAAGCAGSTQGCCSACDPGSPTRLQVPGQLSSAGEPISSNSPAECAASEQQPPPATAAALLQPWSSGGSSSSSGGGGGGSRGSSEDPLLLEEAWEVVDRWQGGAGQGGLVRSSSSSSDGSLTGWEVVGSRRKADASPKKAPKNCQQQVALPQQEQQVGRPAGPKQSVAAAIAGSTTGGTASRALPPAAAQAPGRTSPGSSTAAAGMQQQVERCQLVAGCRAAGAGIVAAAAASGKAVAGRHSPVHQKQPMCTGGSSSKQVVQQQQQQQQQEEDVRHADQLPAGCGAGCSGKQQLPGLPWHLQTPQLLSKVTPSMQMAAGAGAAAAPAAAAGPAAAAPLGSGAAPEARSWSLWGNSHSSSGNSSSSGLSCQAAHASSSASQFSLFSHFPTSQGRTNSSGSSHGSPPGSHQSLQASLGDWEMEGFSRVPLMPAGSSSSGSKSLGGGWAAGQLQHQPADNAGQEQQQQLGMWTSTGSAGRGQLQQQGCLQHKWLGLWGSGWAPLGQACMQGQ